MRYRHRVPRPPLNAFIESIWVYQNDPSPHALERILPTGAAQLIINLKEDQTRLYDPASPHRYVATAGSVLSGVQSRFQVIDTDGFRHDGAWDADALTDTLRAAMAPTNVSPGDP